MAFHRNAFEAKCADLDPGQLAVRSTPPSRLSLLGLLRHLTEMERVYGTWALGPNKTLELVWADYVDDTFEPDFDADASQVEESLVAWRQERTVVDERIGARLSLDDVSEANSRTVRWNLLKLLGEYARHNGHADLIRERIDGRVGE